MGVFIKLMKVPGLTWFFFRVVLSIWNFVWSNLEAVFYLRRRSTSVATLKALRQNSISVLSLKAWYRSKNFVWRRDLLNGFLDFSSKPWVSAARSRGDCDDMMLIAEYVLRRKYSEGRRCYLYASDGRSHAVYLLRAEDDWFVMSNQSSMGPFQSRDEAISSSYGEKTVFSYVI